MIRKKKLNIIVLLCLSLGCFLIVVFQEKDYISNIVNKRNQEWLAEKYLDNGDDVDSEMIVEKQDSELKGFNKEQKREREIQKTYSGVIDCVIEIPCIELKNVVILGGNRDENLSAHYLVAAERKYGDGSYIVCGHHSFQKGVALNRLNEVDVGDVIYITHESLKEKFVVIEKVDAQWGMKESDFNGDNSRLIIYTCREQRERPKPYFVIRAKKQ